MIAWLMAFAIHSTLWCGVAWIYLRLRPKTHARLRETVWLTAIAASFIAPTAQTLVSSTAIWHLPVPPVSRSVDAGHEGNTEHGTREAPSHDGAAATRRGEHERSHDEGAEPAAVAGPLDVAGWAWFFVAGGLMLYYVGRLRAFRNRLRDRHCVSDPQVLRTLVRLSRRAGLAEPPRLTESDDLGSPVALGVGAHREICVPTRALHELDVDELAALLGHEVAHHMRRDTIRLGLLNTLQAVFFFQPLFRLACRDIQFAAEEQCDNWAADQLEDRMAMASCLTEVAGWLVRRDQHVPAPCMGRLRSQLAIRVLRLTDEGEPTGAQGGRLRRLCSITVLVLSPVLAPAVPAVEPESVNEFEHGEQPREHETERHEGPRRERRKHREHDARDPEVEREHGEHDREHRE